jgi:TRAP-type uncharacterized transport system fused permease subunit
VAGVQGAGDRELPQRSGATRGGVRLQVPACVLVCRLRVSVHVGRASMLRLLVALLIVFLCVLVSVLVCLRVCVLTMGHTASG